MHRRTAFQPSRKAAWGAIAVTPETYGMQREPFWAVQYRKWTEVQNLQAFQVSTALAHLGQAAAIGTFVWKQHKTKIYPVSIPYDTWPTKGGPPDNNMFGNALFCDGSIDLGACIFAFFLLSGLWQILASVFLWKTYINTLLDRYVQPFRWAEYSISASLMAVIFALLVGIKETTFLYNIFISFFVVMMLGLLQEVQMSFLIKYKESDDVKPYTSSPGGIFLALFPHILGWFPFIGVVSVFIISFVLSVCGGLNLAECPHPNHPPSWVYGVYISQFIVMSSFAFVQMYHQIGVYFAKKPETSRKYTVRAEYMYTFLSLGAKSSLCWVLFFYLLAESSIKIPPQMCNSAPPPPMPV
jgi:hypothetical protein